MKPFKAQKQELEAEFEPGPKEYDALRAEMKKYKYEEFNGRKWGAFEQAMHHLGVVSLRNGQLFVRNPQEYTKYLKMHSKIEAKDDAELLAIFEQYPEEKIAWEKKRDAFFADWKKSILSMGAKMKVI